LNARLKPILVRPLLRPTYVRWDLVRTNDCDAWIRENRLLLMAWHSDTAQFADAAEPFESFARGQFDIERNQYEQLKADDVGYDDYLTQEDDE
jgi:hypothetical protein